MAKKISLEDKKGTIKELIGQGFLVTEKVLEKLTDDVVFDIKQKGITEENLIAIGLKEKIEFPKRTENIGKKDKSAKDLESVEANGIENAQADKGTREEKAENTKEEKAKEENITLKNNVYDDKQLAKYKIKILNNYNKKPEKKDVSDFTGYFYSRFKQLQNILSENKKLDEVVGILRMSGKKKMSVSFIGMVYEKEETKNGNCIITIEDTTGNIKVLINKNNEKLYNKAKDIVLDEVIGIKGKIDDRIVYADDIIFAIEEEDLSKKSVKKYYKETYGVFVSDLHIGANSTREEKLEKFIEWINGNKGTDEHRAIAKKIRYLFIAGDVIEGVGVYPDQEKELLDKDIYKQYQKVLELLKKVSKEIAIVIIPGNHDSIRLAEPQPALNNSKYSKCLMELENVFLLSNPSSINILEEKDFEGLNMLFYHGYGFDKYFSDVSSIRSNGGYSKGDLLLKFLLKKRHLSPTHDSTLLMPEKEKDSLVIEEIPDYFITGHTHRVFVENYNNITIMSSGTFQEQTEFQKKFGHVPDVAKIVLVNFMTKENRILRF